MDQFFPNSELALTDNKKVSKYDFPWDEVPKGMSFVVDVDKIALRNLRVLASQKGLELKKFFKVVHHPETINRKECYEVAYIKDRELPPPVSSPTTPDWVKKDSAVQQEPVKEEIKKFF